MSVHATLGTFLYQENKPERVLPDYLNMCAQSHSHRGNRCTLTPYFLRGNFILEWSDLHQSEAVMCTPLLLGRKDKLFHRKLVECPHLVSSWMDSFWLKNFKAVKHSEHMTSIGMNGKCQEILHLFLENANFFFWWF